MKKGDFLQLFSVNSPNFSTSQSTINSINSCLYCSISLKTSVSAEQKHSAPCILKLFHRADQLADIFNILFFHKFLNAVRDLHRSVRIIEIRCSHRNSRRSRHNELQSVLRRSDSAHSDNGKLYRVRHLVYHAHRYRFHRRALHTSRLICQRKSSLINIDLHSRQRVDKRKNISSPRFCCLCHFCNVCYIWAQFHDHRLLRVLFHFPGNLLQRLRILSESDTAFLNIGAGYVDLQEIRRFIAQTLHNLAVILCGFSTDIHNDLCIKLLQERKIPFAEHIDSRILKTNGVQHSAGSLRHSGRGIPGPGHIGHSLGHYRSQAVQSHEFTVFHSRAKSPGSSHDRVLQLHTRQSHTGLHHNSTSVLRNTGPSLQTRLLCTWECSSISEDWQTQARQAPIPQAIRSSMEIQQGIPFSRAYALMALS